MTAATGLHLPTAPGLVKRHPAAIGDELERSFDAKNFGAKNFDAKNKVL
jgi:hypothetical protein